MNSVNNDGSHLIESLEDRLCFSVSMGSAMISPAYIIRTAGGNISAAQWMQQRHEGSAPRSSVPVYMPLGSSAPRTTAPAPKAPATTTTTTTTITTTRGHHHQGHHHLRKLG